MTLTNIIIFLLVVIIVILASSLFLLIKKNIFFSEKEKEFVEFVINIFIEYGEDLGIQSKKQHEALVKELKRIVKKIKK